MTRGRWLTADAAAGQILTRRLSIPERYVTHVLGALDQLTHAFNWEEFGTDSAEVAAGIGQGIFDSFSPEDGDNMIGQIVWIGTASMLSYCIPFDAVQRLRVDYPLLFDTIDPVFKDDADHFTLPNLGGVSLVGSGGGYDIGDTGGAETVTLDVSQMPAHDHGYQITTFGDIDLEAVGAPEPTLGLNVPATTTQTGGGQSHENRPPYFVARVGMVFRNPLVLAEAAENIEIITTAELASDAGTIVIEIPTGYRAVKIAAELRGTTSAEFVNVVVTANARTTTGDYSYRSYYHLSTFQSAQDFSASSMIYRYIAAGLSDTGNYSPVEIMVGTNSGDHLPSITARGQIADTNGVYQGYLLGTLLHAEIVDTLTLTPGAGNFATGCKLTVYGER